MPHINLYYKDENPSPLTLVWRRFNQRLLSMTALYILLAMILVVIFSPILAPYSTSMQFADAVSLPPSWTEQGNIQFLMGTDDLGRDMLSRLLIGSIYSLGLPILMVAVSSIIGMVVGAVLGIDRTIKYQTFSRVFDTLLSIPSFLMALIIIAILGTGLFNVALAITLSLIPQFIFVTRNAVHQEWHKSPTPEWGSMLARSLDEVYLSPWSMVLPGVTLFVTIMSINIVGDSLRRALSERVNS